MKSLFVSLIIGLLLAACSNPNSTLPQQGVIELSEAFKAEFELVDTNGEVVSQEDYLGKPMVIYFGFASCPDVCPAALGKMSAMLDALGGKADGLTPLFISIDPERDTPDALKAHLAFDPRIEGLTGSLEQSRTASTNMKVYVQKVATPDSAMPYTMDHQSMFFVVDVKGQPQVALLDSMTPAQLAQAIKPYL